MSARAINPQEIQAHVPAVYSLCRRLVQDEHLAEDATQETFISALKRWDEGRPETRRGWLLKIAASRSVDLLRRRRGWVVTSEVDAVDEKNSFAEVMAVNQENRAHLESALAQLPEDTHRLVLLHCVAEMPYTQIEAECGLSRKTAARLVEAGLAQLRRWMNAAGIRDEFQPGHLALLPLMAPPAGLAARVLALPAVYSATSGPSGATPATPASVSGGLANTTPVATRLRIVLTCAAAVVLALVGYWLMTREIPAAPSTANRLANTEALEPDHPTGALTPRKETPTSAVAADLQPVRHQADAATVAENALLARLSVTARAERAQLRRLFAEPVVDPDHPDRPSAYVLAALAAAGIDTQAIRPADYEALRLPLSIGWIEYLNIGDRTFVYLPPAAEGAAAGQPMPFCQPFAGQLLNLRLRRYAFNEIILDSDSPGDQPAQAARPTVEVKINYQSHGDALLDNLDFAWTQPQPYDVDTMLTTNRLTLTPDLRSQVATLAALAREQDAALVQALLKRADEFGQPGSRQILGADRDGRLMFAIVELFKKFLELAPQQSDLQRFTQVHTDEEIAHLQLPTGQVEDSTMMLYLIDTRDDQLQTIVTVINQAKWLRAPVVVDAALVGRRITGRVRGDSPEKALFNLAAAVPAELVKTEGGGWKLVSAEAPATPPASDGF